MGVDAGILVSDRAFAGSDSWATSYALATAIGKIDDVDMILCGKQASDGDTAQVGPQWSGSPVVHGSQMPSSHTAVPAQTAPSSTSPSQSLSRPSQASLPVGKHSQPFSG